MKRLTLSDYFTVVMKWRRFVFRNVIVVTVITLIVSLVLQFKYTATATILPPNPEQEAMFGIMYGSTIGATSTGLSSLARLSGVMPGFATPSDLYAAIMASGRIKGEIIKKYDLKKEFKAKTMYDAGRALDDITKIEVSPEGIISVSVVYKNKYLATDIANSYVEELDKFNTATTMTVGKKFSLFIEERLKENVDSLVKAEEALRAFKEKHRTVALDTEVESVIKTAAALKSEIIMREIKRDLWSPSSQIDNPYLSGINREIEELKKQLSRIEFGTGREGENRFGAGFSMPFNKLPELSLEYARLFRDVKIQETIYELLTQQYEQAKIMELKDTPTVQFLDRAGVPEKRSYPKRKLLVVLAFLFSLFISIPTVFLLEYLEDVKTHPQKHTIFIKFSNDLSKDFVELKSFFKKIFRRSKN